MLKVLVVDDDRVIRTALVATLENSCYVDEAPTGQTALEIIYEDCPKVILLDVNLPDMPGYDILDTIRNDRRFDGVKVALVSANGGLDNIREGCEVHKADRYFTKPVHIPDIIRWVHKQLAEVSVKNLVSAP